ncbi:dystonin [Caerostris extrusa]|uniref:Dystonin n=1 Tax=Caerostris extrusa TaxID=172846 RepID=A0AAV4XVA3_CAEEX|nr:dystonin [Caerostris extrusa]
MSSEIIRKNGDERNYFSSPESFGASLKDLLTEGILDPESGYLKIDGEHISLEESIVKGLLNPSSAFVVEYQTKKMLTLDLAIKEGWISPTGDYFSSEKKNTFGRCLKSELYSMH